MCCILPPKLICTKSTCKGSMKRSPKLDKKYGKEKYAYKCTVCGNVQYYNYV